MSRALELFAKRGLVPERVDARRTGAAMAIDLEVADLPQDTAEHIMRCLSTMVMVERVLMTGPRDEVPREVPGEAARLTLLESSRA